MSAWFRSFANRQGQIEPRRFRKPRQGGENGDESRMHAAGCGELRRLAQSTQLLGGAVELTLFYDFKWI